jgi:hypothetical protein
MVDKNVYPVKMKSLLLYNDMTQSGVYIFRNVEKSRGGTHLKLTLYIFFMCRATANTHVKRSNLSHHMKSSCLHFDNFMRIDYMFGPWSWPNGRNILFLLIKKSTTFNMCCIEIILNNMTWTETSPNVPKWTLLLWNKQIINDDIDDCMAINHAIRVNKAVGIALMQQRDCWCHVGM